MQKRERHPAMIARIPRLATTAAPITETQGTATTASSIIFGDFRELLIGMRSEMRIEVTPVPFATNHQVAIIAHLRADVQLAQAYKDPIFLCISTTTKFHHGCI